MHKTTWGTLRLVHLYRAILIFSLAFGVFGKDFEDKLQFRLSNDYYTSYLIRQELRDLNFFNCLYPKSILFEKLTQYQNLGVGEKFAFSADFFKLSEANFFLKKNNSLVLDYLRISKLAGSMSLRIPYDERKKILQRIDGSLCKSITKKPKEKIIKFKKIEQLLETRFNLKGLTKKKQKEVLLSFFSSLKTQYYFEKFY